MAHLFVPFMFYIKNLGMASHFAASSDAAFA
ncbi:hypothetical protein X734_00440 [Mesorhizobium sp. L2C084A000]|nr:hypothetical protein X734_00440 [Mesorhizobium sp. L2C084A000]